MLFTAPFFLFAFLPLFLLVYFAAPARARNAILFGASLFFYFTTSGELTVVLILSVVVNHALARAMAASTSPRASTALLVLGIAANLAPLLYYKYAVFLLSSVGRTAGALGVVVPVPDLHPTLPIGISFFTFQAISYIADVHMRRVPPARSLVDFGMYHSCFPQLIAGPIVRYEEIEPEVRHRTETLDGFYHGTVQFCFGLAKKVVVADPVGTIADAVFALPHAELTSASAWLGVLAYTLQIFFDFSGYSDMAIGLGRMLGFPYPQNFDQPYRSLGITEFWRRWHMTLSRWFRDYLYIPLGGNRHGQARTLFNLLVVFVLCGLWHGAAVTFLVWGVYHGALLVAERLLRPLLRVRIPAAIAWAYAMLAIMIGWVFFRAETLGDAVAILGRMLAVDGAALAPSLAPSLASVTTNDKVAALALGTALALLPFHPLRYVGRAPRAYAPAIGAAALACAGLAVVMLSTNSFTPFIYFRF